MSAAVPASPACSASMNFWPNNPWLPSTREGLVPVLSPTSGYRTCAIRFGWRGRRKPLGYDALSALPPHSYPFTDQEIVDYYRQLSAATSVPLIVYEIPSRTGRPLPLETLIEILDFSGVIGMKFSSTDLFKLSTIKRLRPGKLLFSGFDEIYAASAILGADGGIGTTYNILGRLYVALDEAIRQGDVARSQELQTISQRFVEIILRTGVIAGVKAALRAHGVDVGPTRKPLTALVPDIDIQMASVIAEPGIRDWLA